MLTLLVMLSDGGVSLTERQHPTNTHNEAVATMLMFAGTLSANGSTVRIRSRSWAMIAVEPPAAAASNAFCSLTASFADDITYGKQKMLPVRKNVQRQV